MPTFIDESGDPGPGDASPRFFRLAAVWFETFDHVETVVEAIAQLKKDKLKVGDSFEFHFSEISHQQRVAFFEAVADQPFYFAACSFDKDRGNRKTLTKEVICATCIADLTRELHDYYLVAEAEKIEAQGPVPLHERIVYDESRDPDYIHLLKEGFKALASNRGEGAKLVKSVKPGKSKADVRLQLADMVCGAARLHLEGDSAYHKLIGKRALRCAALP